MRCPEYSSRWRSAGKSGLAQRAHSSSRSITRSSRCAAPQKMQRTAPKNSPASPCGWKSSPTVIYAPAMSKLRLYQIDAFTDRRFGGNPAAVVPLERWLEDAVLQAVALENNLAETAYFVPENGGFRLRWFTPTVEVELCGHATLASAFVLFTELDPGRDAVTFATRSGP